MADRPSSGEFTLETTSSAGAEATTALGRLLTGDAAAVRDRAVVLIAELVASEASRGGRTGQPAVAVKVISDPRSVRIELRDAGSGIVLGALRRSTMHASEVWGPHLLSRVADRWGLVSGADGSWLWFELDLSRGRDAVSDPD